MFNAGEDMAVEAKMFTSSVEMAQKRVESNNFSVRKNVLQFDDVMNQQRELIYSQRNQVLDGVDMDATIRKMIKDTITEAVDFYCPSSNSSKDWNRAGLVSKYGWLLGADHSPKNKTHFIIFLKCVYFKFYFLPNAFSICAFTSL